ncbi:MAG: hypothetical protein ACO31I_15175 [Prochlorotrichaceae cyanobacterium]|jgi:hypothetical protein
MLDWIEDLQNWVSPRLEIRFDSSADPLKIYRPDGELFVSYEERSQQLEQERQWADQERERADRLAAKLQELGIELL